MTARSLATFGSLTASIAPRAGTGAQIRIVVASIVFVLLLQAHQVFNWAINWDEFFFHSKVYVLQAGALDRALQSVSARLFAWLPWIPGSEIAEIRAGRMVMLLCEIVTATAIGVIAQRFSDRICAALCALAYISGGFVFIHGFSFRFDPLAAALLMSALALLFVGALGRFQLIAAALLVALAGLVTVKSVFYAPAFLGAASLRIAEARDPVRTARQLAGAALLCLVAFAGMFLLHSLSLPAAGSDGGAGKTLGSAARNMFTGPLFPRLHYLLKQVSIAPLLTMLLLAAPFVILRSRLSWAERAAFFGLLAPLLTLAVYVNSFPYFYAFILAPACAALAIILPTACRRYGGGLLALLLAANALALYAATPRSVQKNQAAVLAAVHRMFPAPVPYIDFNAFVSTFPKRGFFMSDWGMDEYAAAGEPVFSQILLREPVPLLIDNHRAFAQAFEGRAGYQSLLPADARLIRENYIPHWGPIRVAGKQLRAGAQTAEIFIPGPYTVENGHVLFRDHRYEEGDVMILPRGPAALFAPRGAVLRWGRALYRPSGPPPPGIFLPF